MNAKATRKVLNVAFKQFQRLPDWPPVKVSEGRPLSHESREAQRQPILPLPGPSKDASGSQAFAE